MNHFNSNGEQLVFADIPKKFLDLARDIIMSCDFHEGESHVEGEFPGLLDEDFNLKFACDVQKKGFILSVTKSNGSAFVSMHYVSSEALQYFRPTRNWICKQFNIDTSTSIIPMGDGIIDAASKDFLKYDSDAEVLALISEALAYRLTNENDKLSYENLSKYAV